ncbi:hypothetical protein E2562_017681 [Oryza meyeriana var. granulata]|uniref:Clathrin/coatomer adaptor adaptin-like N-terminal domain-containing protein n=1 Tax=Oryza meyeriana var. granulata TaxID=110450 RepID=A0A6G1BYC8_9ORYZ|nr:hypothetical protein E2562_017681 [Oryza meyeriana var. granulata]
MNEKPCTLLVYFKKRYPVIANITLDNLVRGDDAAKAIRKLLLLYLEIVFTGDDIFGRVPPETALVCSHLRDNLDHPNVYIRGATLRFVWRLRGHLDLLEPLVDSVLANLDHGDPFVRRHALSAVFAIHHLFKPSGGHVLPDAIDRVERALAAEQDAAARRNAFRMLSICALEQAATYLLANADRVAAEWPAILQMAAINLICRLSYWPFQDQERYINIIMALLPNPTTSSCVVYECAGALLFLSSAPVAVTPTASWSPLRGTTRT